VRERWMLQLRSVPIWLRHGGSKTQGCSGFVMEEDARNGGGAARREGADLRWQWCSGATAAVERCGGVRCICVWTSPLVRRGC